MKAERIDSMGRRRQSSQGGAGPKHFPVPNHAESMRARIELGLPDEIAEHLDAKEFFDTAVAAMSELGIAHRSDATFLTLGAMRWSHLMAAVRDIARRGVSVAEETGHGTVVRRNDSLATVEKAFVHIMSWLSSAGMTPSARAKFAPGGQQKSKLESLLEKAAKIHPIKKSA